MSHIEQRTSTGTGVDPQAIERQLTEMWRVMTESPGSGPEAAVTRACILNLITCCTPSDDRQQLEQLLDEVTELTPCRAFVIVLEPDSSETAMDAYISSRCHLSARGSKQVCCEQVTIEAKGSAVNAVSSAVAPLLVSDVPVFLWWNRTPAVEEPVFTRLCNLTDRLIVDSGTFTRPYHGLLRLSSFIDNPTLYRPLSDLNWGRLTSWRSLVASLWDVAEYRPFLTKIDSVILGYDAPTGCREISAKALLGLGWLASRLGWRLIDAQTTQNPPVTRLTYRWPSGTDIRAEVVRSGEPEGREGPLTRLVLSCSAAGHPPAEFRVGLKQKGCKLETVSNVGGRLEMDRVLQYEPRSDGVRLAAELALLETDRVYEQTVRSAAEIAEALHQAKSPGNRKDLKDFKD